MEIDKTGLREWTFDTDAVATYHLWLPREATEETVRAALEHYMYAGEHESPFAEAVQVPDGLGGCIELVCAAPRRTGRAIIDVAGEDAFYCLGPDDNKHIDGAWEGKHIAQTLAAYDTAADLPALLAAAEALANTVRATMIDAPTRPADPPSVRIAELLERMGQGLAEDATAYEKATQREDGGDAEYDAAAQLRSTAHAAAELLGAQVDGESR